MKHKITILCCLCFGSMFAQFSGNRNYQDKYNYNNSNNRDGLNNYSASDSTLDISVNIMLNQKADTYVLTMGVNEEQKTPKECMTIINQRIENLLAKVAGMGIKKDEVFVDFISQTKIYDYELGKTQDRTAEQTEKGFEVKKNIIIRLTNYADIEKIILAAADYKIYDIIKVDYLSDNIEAVYEKMMAEAKAILDKKKNNYVAMFNCKLVGEPMVADNFNYVFPKDQYRKYEAFESSEVNNYSSDLVKKTARKNSTFYYEGLDYPGYDKVINSSNPEVGIQYVLKVHARYKKVKSK